MSSELISIIIPVYNVEKYLDRCLKSVIGQSYSNLEIILIDDGSTDHCPKMCDDWSQKDNRIKVFHKKNAGLGMARNTGLDNASGDYVFFIDSDDYIELDTVKKCVSTAADTKAEIVIYGFNNVRDDKVVGAYPPKAEKRYYSDAEVQDEFLPLLIANDPRTHRVRDLVMSACACMYSMSLIRRAQWRFVSEREIISEDVYSLLQLYKYVQSVAIIEEAFYNYCYNEVSLSHSYRKDRYVKLVDFYNKSIQLARECGFSDIVIDKIKHLFIAFVIGALKLIAQSDDPQRRIDFKKIVVDPVLQETLHSIILVDGTLSRKIFLFCLKHKIYSLAFIFAKLKK